MGNQQDKSSWHKSMHQCFYGDIHKYKVTEHIGQKLDLLCEECVKFMEYEGFRHDAELEFQFDVMFPGSGMWNPCTFKYGNDNRAKAFTQPFPSLLLEYIVNRTISVRVIAVLNTVTVTFK